jgi:cobalamin biosynthesis protein CobD/CbiB
MSVEINMVASRHDGRRTTHFIWMPILGALTLGIYMFVWLHKLCNRIGNELRRRNVQYKFSAATFWLWNFVYGMVAVIVTGVVGYVLIYVLQMELTIAYIVTGVLGLVSCVGPAVFGHKILKAFNLMNADYNEKG